MAKQLTPAQREHWSRVQSQVIGRFDFFRKPKVKPAMVVQLAGEIADLSVAELRKRTRK